MRLMWLVLTLMVVQPFGRISCGEEDYGTVAAKSLNSSRIAKRDQLVDSRLMESLTSLNNFEGWWKQLDRQDAVVDDIESRKKKGGFRKKLKRYLLPLLIAYKLKFFTLIPVMIGGLVLLTGATGLAGFFFALFAAVMGLKGGHSY
ncbi:hypothetical protein GWI33_007075 [Rhynchophorus ferrugineus]|uniref:Uncharacterized protein n=1 Tax=Rhynchophorus ferrugineus TaxID=354439 RepID=A0A834MF22_RHYFE|nr:hypothetical protein GWI33_007075 [Rhynchophorus ferrugineus]